MQPAVAREHEQSLSTRVLVIDDDSAMLQLVRSVLETHGYACITASDGEEALRVLDSATDVPVAISDIEMPGMDGIQFLQNIESGDGPAAAPRVIFLTAHARVDFAVAALRLGAVDFLTKPVRAQELLGAIKSAVDRVQRDRVASQLPGQVATLAQQAEALASALRGWTHSQAEQGVVVTKHAGVGAKPEPARAADLALLGIDHLRRPRRPVAPLGELDDTAWDLLVQLLRAEKSGRRLSVSALSISVEDVSSTTALRRIQELVKAGHIARHPDPLDARRDFVVLAEQSRSAIEQYLEHVGKELAAAASSA